jgi:hypothetical protein
MYISSREEAISKGKDKERKESRDRKAGNLAHIDQMDDGSIYYASETALIAITPSNWNIDSGASKHFSIVKSDFVHIKRWRTPKQVCIANGKSISALGQGTINVETYTGILTLKNAWYIPKFNCRLISAMTLNEDGISILLENKKAIGRKGKLTVFTANGRSGVYQLNTSVPTTAVIAEPDPGNNPVETETAHRDTTSPDTKESTLELWHRRLGHSNSKYIAKMKESAAMGITFPKHNISPGDKACEPCLAGKMKESFHKTDTMPTLQILTKRSSRKSNPDN